MFLWVLKVVPGLSFVDRKSCQIWNNFIIGLINVKHVFISGLITFAQYFHRWFQTFAKKSENSFNFGINFLQKKV